VSKFAIVLSGNIAFRTGPQSRISTIVASASYTQNKQFIMPVLSSIWTKNNKFNFVGDIRYYQYPQSTYGLGSSSSIKSEDPMDFSFARFYETVLRHVTGNWYAGLGYAIDTYWNVSQTGANSGAQTDYTRYGTLSHSVSSGLTLNLLHDSRDNSINPAKGWYGSVQYRDNVEFLGSTQGWQSLIIDLRKYIRFPANSDNVLALWSYNWFILSGKPSYLNLPSTSWDPNSATGRGYIQGRFRGAQMVYAESEYRFKITNNGLLGGVVFANAQSLSAQQGTRLQAIQPAFGPGLRLKLNKTSRTNVAVDYGFGREGSRGLFIDVGEIF
jgi:outer membrane protein assembly factor BamA